MTSSHYAADDDYDDNADVQLPDFSVSQFMFV